MINALKKLEAFNFQANINWYPGHMAKAKSDLSKRLKYIDTVFEVRDARIPFSSANPHLDELTKGKRRVIIFNKSDLADPSNEKKISAFFKSKDQSVRFFCGNRNDRVANEEMIRFGLGTKMAKQQNVAKARPTFQTIGTQYSNFDDDFQRIHNILIVGIPNVGKSTIINSLKNTLGQSTRADAKTGPNPGVTRQVSSFKISDRPPAYLVDSPGVMVPNIENTDIGLDLVLTGAIKDIVVSNEIVANWLVYRLWNSGKLGSLSFISGVNVEEVAKKTNCDTYDFIEEIARAMSFKSPGGEWNTDAASRHLIERYRKGDLGRFTLENVEMEIEKRQTKNGSKEMEKSKAP